jgi:hypothetical protein
MVSLLAKFCLFCRRAFCRQYRAFIITDSAAADQCLLFQKVDFCSKKVQSVLQGFVIEPTAAETLIPRVCHPAFKAAPHNSRLATKKVPQKNAANQLGCVIF